MLRYSICLLISCSFMLLSGCGGSNARGELSEEQKVAAVVMAISDAAGDEETFQNYFVSGKAPNTGEEYSSCVFEVPEDPVISGDEATAKVKLTTGMADSSQSDSPKPKASGAATKETREVTWTLAKSGGEWKIKNAPLN